MLKTINDIIESGLPYVYMLSDNCVPFYIGKGKGSRLYSHEEMVKNPSLTYFGIQYDYNPYKTRKIQKILRENRIVEYQILAVFQRDEDALEYEKNIIKYYGRKGIDKKGILTNITEGEIGGDTYHGLSPERKIQRTEKSSKASKGRKRSPESIEKTRQAHLGKIVSKETRRLMSLSKIGIPSNKKGIPATGGNAKGIKKAWNKNISPEDPRAKIHSRSCSTVIIVRSQAK